MCWDRLTVVETLIWIHVPHDRQSSGMPVTPNWWPPFPNRTPPTPLRLPAGWWLLPRRHKWDCQDECRVFRSGNTTNVCCRAAQLRWHSVGKPPGESGDGDGVGKAMPEPPRNRRLLMRSSWTGLLRSPKSFLNPPAAYQMQQVWFMLW